MTRPTCGSCRFFDVGECRRYPPTVVVDTQYHYLQKQLLPRVYANTDWCGEHKPKEQSP